MKSGNIKVDGKMENEKKKEKKRMADKKGIKQYLIILKLISQSSFEIHRKRIDGLR